MHRYFLIFEIGFMILMVSIWGWWAGAAAAVFVVLSVIANLSRENERNEKEFSRQFDYEQQVQELCRDAYKKILDDVPGAASLIADYYYDRNKENENFMTQYAKEKDKK